MSDLFDRYYGTHRKFRYKRTSSGERLLIGSFLIVLGFSITLTLFSNPRYKSEKPPDLPGISQGGYYDPTNPPQLQPDQILNFSQGTITPRPNPKPTMVPTPVPMPMAQTTTQTIIKTAEPPLPSMVDSPSPSDQTQTKKGHPKPHPSKSKKG